MKAIAEFKPCPGCYLNEAQATMEPDDFLNMVNDARSKIDPQLAQDGRDYDCSLLVAIQAAANNKGAEFGDALSVCVSKQALGECRVQVEVAK